MPRCLCPFVMVFVVCHLYCRLGASAGSTYGAGVVIVRPFEAKTHQVTVEPQQRLPRIGSLHRVWGVRSHSSFERVQCLRGGGKEEEDDEEGDDWGDMGRFGDEDEDDEDGVEEGDYGEAGFLGRLKQDWLKTPIITKTFFRASLVMTLAVYLLNRNEWPAVLSLEWKPAILKLQLWRLVTPFLYLGPLGVNFLITAHFSWTYMSQLEKLHYREPHTFAMLLLFGMTSLLLLNFVVQTPESQYGLGHSLSCFLVFVWSRKYAGTKVNILDMFEMSTELLPYFFVAQTLMIDGQVPWLDLTGVLIGYGWQTLSMKGIVKAPAFLVNLFRNSAFLRAEYARAGREYGQDDAAPGALQEPMTLDGEGDEGGEAGGDVSGSGGGVGDDEKGVETDSED